MLLLPRDQDFFFIDKYIAPTNYFLVHGNNFTVINATFDLKTAFSVYGFYYHYHAVNNGQVFRG